MDRGEYPAQVAEVEREKSAALRKLVICNSAPDTGLQVSEAQAAGPGPKDTVPESVSGQLFLKVGKDRNEDYSKGRTKSHSQEK